MRIKDMSVEIIGIIYQENGDIDLCFRKGGD